mmetsp:Transcript_13765/g.27494  ORF Transcript_13765/g.27494 Transcript_13765/m.27494 type:complete len:202 (+) Transcript_13765:62-667(+)
MPHLRLLLRRVPRRDHLLPRRLRGNQAWGQDPIHEYGEELRGGRGGGAGADAAACREPPRWRGRLHRCRNQDGGGRSCGRHHHARAGTPPCSRAPPRIRRSQTHGVVRHVPHGRQGLRSTPGFAVEAETERRGAHVRAGEQRRHGLRLPLRLPRPPPHGCRTDKAGTGVQLGPDRYGPLSRLPGQAQQGGSLHAVEPGRAA